MDVQELLDQWQASAAWHAGSISPDVASLAAWMAGQLANKGGLKLTRSSADPLYDLVAAYLAGQGVTSATRSSGPRTAARPRRRGPAPTSTPSGASPWRRSGRKASSWPRQRGFQ